MENKVNYTLVGVFVLVLAGLMAFITIWLTMGTEQKEFVRYQVNTDESVSGLTVRSPVAYRGVDVGKVVEISLNKEDPSFVDILLDIEEGVPIKEDTRAVLVGRGITGLMNVGLTGGSKSSAALLPTKKNPVPLIPNGPSLGKRLDEAFEQIMGSVSGLTTHVATVLDEKNTTALSQILVNTERLTKNLADSSEDVAVTLKSVRILAQDLRPQLGSLLTTLNKSLAGKGGALSQVPQVVNEIQHTLASVKLLSDSLLHTSDSIKRFADASNQRVQSTAPQLNSLMGDIQDLVDSLRRVSNQLEREPNMLLFGKPQSKPGPGEK